MSCANVVVRIMGVGKRVSKPNVLILAWVEAEVTYWVVLRSAAKEKEGEIELINDSLEWDLVVGGGWAMVEMIEGRVDSRGGCWDSFRNSCSAVLLLANDAGCVDFSARERAEKQNSNLKTSRLFNISRLVLQNQFASHDSKKTMITEQFSFGRGYTLCV